MFCSANTSLGDSCNYVTLEMASEAFNPASRGSQSYNPENIDNRVEGLLTKMSLMTHRGPGRSERHALDGPRMFSEVLKKARPF